MFADNPFDRPNPFSVKCTSGGPGYYASDADLICVLRHKPLQQTYRSQNDTVDRYITDKLQYLQSKNPFMVTSPSTADIGSNGLDLKLESIDPTTCGSLYSSRKYDNERTRANTYMRNIGMSPAPSQSSGSRAGDRLRTNSVRGFSPKYDGSLSTSTTYLTNPYLTGRNFAQKSPQNYPQSAEDLKNNRMVEDLFNRTQVPASAGAINPYGMMGQLFGQAQGAGMMGQVFDRAQGNDALGRLFDQAQGVGMMGQLSDQAQGTGMMGQLFDGAQQAGENARFGGMMGDLFNQGQSQADRQRAEGEYGLVNQSAQRNNNEQQYNLIKRAIDRNREEHEHSEYDIVSNAAERRRAQEQYQLINRNAKNNKNNIDGMVSGLFNMTLDQSTVPRNPNNKIVEDYVGNLLVGVLGQSGQLNQPGQSGVFIPPGQLGQSSQAGAAVSPILPLQALRVQQQFVISLQSRQQDVINVQGKTYFRIPMRRSRGQSQLH